MADAAPQIADPIIRNRGRSRDRSRCGSVRRLGNGLARDGPPSSSPIEEGQPRNVKARDFFSGPFSTALEPTEILSEIRIPAAKPMTGGSYLKLERNGRGLRDGRGRRAPRYGRRQSWVAESADGGRPTKP